MGLIALATLLFLGLLAGVASGSLPGTAVAKAVSDRLLCAVRASGSCRGSDPLTAAYGAETAMLVRRLAPNIAYERGMRAMPVDFRQCRADPSCGDGPPDPRPAWRTNAGLPVTAFVRVIERPGGGEPSHVQYWFYYADSHTLRRVLGSHGAHPDDWESYQVRLRPGHHYEARASSHHGYVTHTGPQNGLAETGLAPRSAWTPATGWLFVAGGSHAGRTHSLPGEQRVTPASRLQLIPLETLEERPDDFAVVPPWRKPVYDDPESART